MPEIRAELRRLWIEYGLIVFRGSRVTPEFQVDLSEVFGESEIHPVASFQHPEIEKLIRITTDTSGDDEDLIEVDGNVVAGWIPWHKDIVFTERLNHGGILHATKIVSSGGETGYLDQIEAYERLSPRMQRAVEDLEVVYHVTPIDESSFYADEKVRYLKVGAPLRAMLERDWPRVVHPLVIKQPGTERKLLNYSPLWAQHVVGMDRDESDALLQELSAFLWNIPAYYHEWEPDDMVLWDNWRMLHRVMPAPFDEVRVVERTTISGDYGFGRIL
ncbi:MAG: TauD/TfdA family dioxygenase [Sphingomonadaceae bacterium]|nr:TauD/TfdA family dioxygenase [Sphingomonadaceae bacterium]